MQPAPTWHDNDVDGIHRVATRIGIVDGVRGPQETVSVLRNLAVRTGRDPNQRIALYAEIARTTCDLDAPVCIRCPLKDACEFHARMQTERHKSRSVIRRLWGR